MPAFMVTLMSTTNRRIQRHVMEAASQEEAQAAAEKANEDNSLDVAVALQIPEGIETSEMD